MARRRFEAVTGAADKDALFDFLAKAGISSHQVLVGEIAYEGRLSREMVTDVESLLIAGLRPRGNIAAIGSRIARPGLSVRCIGKDWPSEFRHFVDQS